MAQRGISELEVEAVLNGWHERYTDKDGNSVLIAKFEGRRLKVVVAKDSDPPKVITAGD